MWYLYGLSSTEILCVCLDYPEKKAAQHHYFDIPNAIRLRDALTKVIDEHAMIPTHDEAFMAVADPAIPLDDALKTFERAHRRSNEITRGFALHCALLCRSVKKDDQPC